MLGQIKYTREKNKWTKDTAILVMQNMIADCSKTAHTNFWDLSDLITSGEFSIGRGKNGFRIRFAKSTAVSILLG